MLACALKSWRSSEYTKMTPGGAGTRAWGETQPNPFLFQSEKLQLMPFLYLVSLKILFEESLQRLVFLVVLFCFV